MMRALVFLLALGLLPLAAHAQFGPLVPEACKTCPCGFGGVLAIIQNGMNFAIGLTIIFATIILAWAGALFVLSATNPEQRGTARKMFMNVVIGLVIVLSAWLMVDFVMKTLYGGRFGPWNSILSTSAAGASSCIVANPDMKQLFSGDLVVTPGTGGSGPGTPSTMDPLPDADGRFTYQSGISAQAGHASLALNNLLSCMAQRVPANVGEISSISDSGIVNGTRSFGYCATNQCAHSAGSCHYGGRGQCNGSSYAVDFGDGNSGTANERYLIAAARACGADFINPEGHHLHVSVGRSVGCGCN